MTAYDLGSSPRGRGKLGEFHDLGVSERLIPAWAGKTAGGGGLGSHDLGSSPRGRGKLSRALPPRCRRRLIPAWAGKTAWRRLSARGSPAHPRVGGENICRLSRPRCLTGSSPRGRGKRIIVHSPTNTLRLIPAWAGKTRRSPRADPPSGAHPRVGGENSAFSFQADAAWGSSPRGRGKPRSDLTRYHGPRLIPAWAGKTSSSRSAGPDASAHPRVGGENSDRAVPEGPERGSSPRGRGKPRSRSATPWGSPAHPRVGGENLLFGRQVTRIAGSSPRGRGKQARHGLHARQRGLIPAWAGKTLSDLRFYRADRSDLGNP